jgi:hypothetical protein
MSRLRRALATGAGTWELQVVFRGLSAGLDPSPDARLLAARLGIAPEGVVLVVTRLRFLHVAAVVTKINREEITAVHEAETTTTVPAPRIAGRNAASMSGQTAGVISRSALRVTTRRGDFGFVFDRNRREECRRAYVVMSELQRTGS